MVHSKRKMNKKLLITLIIVGVCIVVGGGYYWYKKHQKFVPSPSSNSETKGEVNPSNETAGGNSGNTPSTNGTGSAQNPSSGSGDTSNKNSSSGTNVKLVAPDGTFVSSHHVSMDVTIASNCTTTPGATCQISFTKDGTTKSLDSRTTDKGGGAYWSWKPQDIGLTSGSWKVKATATLNGKSLSADDALNLEVQ